MNLLMSGSHFTRALIACSRASQETTNPEPHFALEKIHTSTGPQNLARRGSKPTPVALVLESASEVITELLANFGNPPWPLNPFC